MQTADSYPDRNRGVPDRTTDDPEAEKNVLANLLYLEEHGLIEAGLQQSLDGKYSSYGTKITAKGLDFLEDDGGLSAILGTVTIRMHADSIKALLLAKIDASVLPAEEKSRLKKHLDALTGEAWKQAGKYLMEQGLNHLPAGLSWLEKLSGLS